jgi:DNA replication protein DnaC
MTVKVSAPLEWKSAKWWANRPAEERLALAGIPRLYKSFDMGTIAPELADLGYEWLNERFQKPSPGLLITGRAGSGKTGLAQALGKEIIARHKKAAYFISADRYVEMVKDTFDNDNELPEMYEMPHLLRYVKDVFHVVILDALGRERPTDFSRYEIGALLRRRYEECRPIIVTTSLSMSEIANRYGDSALSVLTDLDTINVNGLL